MQQRQRQGVVVLLQYSLEGRQRGAHSSRRQQPQERLLRLRVGLAAVLSLLPLRGG